jgi:phosphoribosylformylglycinamidine synthase
MAWHVSVYVTLKPSVMDPQGATVQRALHGMGYKAVTGFEGGLSEAEVRKQADEICDKLLANPNIESYRFTLEKK